MNDLDTIVNNLPVKKVLYIGMYKGEHSGYLFLGDNANKYDKITIIDQFRLNENPKKFHEQWEITSQSRIPLILDLRKKITNNNTTLIIDDYTHIDYERIEYDLVFFGISTPKAENFRNIAYKASYVIIEGFAQHHKVSMDAFLNKDVDVWEAEQFDISAQRNVANLIQYNALYNATLVTNHKKTLFLICNVNNEVDMRDIEII